MRSAMWKVRKRTFSAGWDSSLTTSKSSTKSRGWIDWLPEPVGQGYSEVKRN
jgi:hypothetical protein